MIYIADASIIGQTPALIIYDVDSMSGRRVLEGHVSVEPEDYVMHVEGDPQVVAGIFAIRPGVDSIALDAHGEWLYFSAITTNHMYRARTRDLEDAGLLAEALTERVERLPTPKTMSDGIAIDAHDTLYLTDPEHSAVVTLASNGELVTLLKDARFRWPDGFSFGSDGWLYFTCSALQHVIMKSEASMQEHAPFHIYRFRPPSS